MCEHDPDDIGFDEDDHPYWNMGLDEKGELERCCPNDFPCEWHNYLELEPDCAI